MQRRVMGLETEYGVRWVAQQGGGGAVSAQRMLETLVERCEVPRIGSFLVNGSRLYPDCGHVEYATAEACDPTSVVVADRAGEELVSRLSQQASHTLGRWGIAGAELYKHSSDGKGSVFGCHENYMVDSSNDLTELAQRLGPYLLTRGVWAGAGGLDHATGRYTLTQRGCALASVTGLSSTRMRPLVHLKDEALCDVAKWRRLHVLAGDANVSEEVTWLKLAVTSLVLSVLEERPARWRNLTPEQFRAALATVDGDLAGTGRYRCETGRYVTALDVQWRFHTAVANHLDRHGGEPWAPSALQRWGELLELLERDGAAGLVGVADWATKLSLLEQVAGRSGGMRSAKVAYADVQYHNVAGGYARRLEGRGAMRRISTPGAVEAAERAPVEATRAQVRAEFIAHAEDREDAVVNWAMVRLGSHELRLGDPFESNSGRLWRWLEAAGAGR